MPSDRIHIPSDRPVLIAGPTASGKSALAMRIAEAQGGVIVNADALQVFDGWRIVTARPSPQDATRIPHALYGHVPLDAPYSVGQWLRDLAPYLHRARPIIVGGTGLYLSALTEGLAEIPATPPEIRKRADAMTAQDLRSDIDGRTKARIDLANRARVQRAWEVQASTGRSLADWQDDTPPPMLPLAQVTALRVDAPKTWLTPRIATRFDAMLAAGALDEARRVQPHWDPSHASSKAIGAAELIAHFEGRMTLDAAREAVIVATRQYAKRQRTWFRRRMAGWQAVDASSTDPSTGLRLD